MEISFLPLSSSTKTKLLSAGYTTFSSLSVVSSSELARDTKVSEAEAVDILNAVSMNAKLHTKNKGHAIAGAISAWEILQEEQLSITTFCDALDTMLGGGISCKEVTEIGGVPGIGKTQLGIQLAVDVQIPIELGGLGGKAIYIDTEGSFMVERAIQIAEACIRDVLDKHAKRGHTSFQTELQPETFLASIIYFRICTYTEQIALVNYLDKFISEQKDVKLVIIDSITFHFRQDFEDLILRTRVLGQMALKLMKLAKKYALAVVLFNQVATKIIDGSFQLTLALGDGWSHASTNRLILHWKGNRRCAYLEKSPSRPSTSTLFSVTSKGIRNVDVTSV